MKDLIGFLLVVAVIGLWFGLPIVLGRRLPQKDSGDDYEETGAWK